MEPGEMNFACGWKKGRGMVKLKRKLMNLAVGLYFKTVGSSLKQGLVAGGGREPDPETAELLCRAAEEGAILLRNHEAALPLSGRTALFGRVQIDSFYTGYGSGGDVFKPYCVSILEGAEKNSRIRLDAAVANYYRDWCKAHPANRGYWGNWPFSFEEAPLEEEFVRESAKRSENAVVVIGRASGEDRDNELTEGSFYLSAGERKMLETVTKFFQKTIVVLNVGTIIDFSFLDEYKIKAALLVFQGGMEMGNAVARLLSGEANPCGRLSLSVAKKYESYPSAKSFGDAEFNEYREDIFVGYRGLESFSKDSVLFPFGFGLSYTSFEMEASLSAQKIDYRVKNRGKRAGREVVQVYLKKPGGGMSQPVRELIGFCKTKRLLPGEEERGTIALSEREFYSYDEELSAYVLLAGKYEIFVGKNVRDAEKIGEFEVEERCVKEQLSQQCAPKRSFELMAEGGVIKFPRLSGKDLRREILKSLPESMPIREQGIKFKDVKSGKADMRTFVAQLSLEELEAISRGDYKMDSPLGASGNAGVLGGVTESLRKRGIPPVTATDGPSGIRLKTPSALLPIATLLSCTFDEALVREVYAYVGREMKERESDVLLAPAMNIQRNPLCGRNFEYFSEDPYLTGKMGAAVVSGLQESGVSACPKHFACNQQEFNRNHNDSRVSERALREIYLRGFEICVKEGRPHFIMTSYNKVNGVWSHYHYELVRGILRGEWNFDGCVITDWWMRDAKSPEFPLIKRNAYRVRAGVNVLMPGGGILGRRKPDGTLLKSLGKEGGITLGELQRNAEEILNAILRSSAFERFSKEEKEKRHK